MNKTQIPFTPGTWEDAGLIYAYSWRFPELPIFRQEADCIVNSEAPGTSQLYDYMGILTPVPYPLGTKLSVRCSFEDLAAPMLTICDRHEIDENGILRTLDYYELVMYKNGLNVWRMHTNGRNVSYYKVLGASFPVTCGEPHTLSAELQQNRMLLQVDEQKLNLYLHDLPDSFLIGYTACEGICRLYEMTIE